MREANYQGDLVYSIRCTGDCVVGDEVCFERAIFSGTFKNPKFSGFERLAGKIVKEFYGAEKQQHTFTLTLTNGSTTRIKGRNLYRNGTWRKPWDNESLRDAVLEEKHMRGYEARLARDIRKSEQEEYYA